MEIQQLKECIASGGAGRFIFTGAEGYLLRHYLTQLRQVTVPDAFTEAFNYVSFDGARIDVPRLLDAIMAPPMMSERKLVVWTYPDLDGMRPSDKKALCELLERAQDYPYTTLVFVCSPEQFDVGNLPKKPSELYKTLSKLVDIVEFRTSTDAQLLAWLKKHFDAERIGVDAEVLRAMLARCGHSMQVLRGEVDKLVMFARATARTRLEPSHITQVCAPTFESQTFALTDALRDGDRAAAFAALRTLRAERADVLMVVGMMARTYAELTAVCALLEEGCDQQVIASELKLLPFIVRRDVASVKKQGPARLYAALAALGRIDEQLKRAARADVCALERFVAGYLM